MKKVIKKLNGLADKARTHWAQLNEIYMAPIAFILFYVVFSLIAWIWPMIPLPGPARLVGPMWGACLVFVGWASGTLSFYWNSKERFYFLFKSGPQNVFEKTKEHSYQLGNRHYITAEDGKGGEQELWNGASNYPNFKFETLELFRCHVLYLWHCSIFVFGLILSQ